MQVPVVNTTDMMAVFPIRTCFRWPSGFESVFIIRIRIHDLKKPVKDVNEYG